MFCHHVPLDSEHMWGYFLKCLKKRHQETRRAIRNKIRLNMATLNNGFIFIVECSEINVMYGMTCETRQIRYIKTL